MPIIEDISFHLDKGEFVTLIGPSGCGKSTIFNMIAGIVPIDEGKIYIDGQDYTGESGHVSYMLPEGFAITLEKGD